MAGSCEIVFEKEIYHPGESINGKLNCNFFTPCTVRDIKITFSGRAKVAWKTGKHTNTKCEPFFDMESSLLQCETKFEPGTHAYPFTFNLPDNLPSSMDSASGNIQYKAKGKIDKEWSLDDTCKKFFTVYACNYLSTMCSSPVELVEEKIPSSLSVNGPIRLTVNLPRDSYAPNDMVTFVAKINNDSSTTVKELRFQIVQDFSFHTDTKSTEDTVSGSEEFAVVDSVVNPHTEKLWNLELRVPADTFIGTLANCEIIKVYWRLKGEVCLPFPHRNMNIEVPLNLGSNAAAPTKVL